MEAYGAPASITSFVVPTGYSFNLDGSTLYQSIGGQQHDKGDARHASDPLRGHHQGQHQGDLLPDGGLWRAGVDHQLRGADRLLL
jgi:hypothetical protein